MSQLTSRSFSVDSSIRCIHASFRFSWIKNIVQMKHFLLGCIPYTHFISFMHDKNISILLNRLLKCCLDSCNTSVFFPKMHKFLFWTLPILFKKSSQTPVTVLVAVGKGESVDCDIKRVMARYLMYPAVQMTFPRSILACASRCRCATSFPSTMEYSNSGDTTPIIVNSA